MTSRADRLAHQQQKERGIGTNKRAVKFSGQDYQTLRTECLRSGRLFEDRCFPAGSRSLGYEELGPYSFKSREVVWKRPKVKKIQIPWTEKRTLWRKRVCETSHNPANLFCCLLLLKELCPDPKFIEGGATRTDICQGALGKTNVLGGGG